MDGKKDMTGGCHKIEYGFTNGQFEISLMSSNTIHVQYMNSVQGGKKPRSDCLGQVHFVLGQVKIEVQ